MTKSELQRLRDGMRDATDEQFIVILHNYSCGYVIGLLLGVLPHEETEALAKRLLSLDEPPTQVSS